MQNFVAASAAPTAACAAATLQASGATDAVTYRVTQHALQQQIQVLRTQRRAARALRQQQDAVWRRLRGQQRAARAARRCGVRRGRGQVSRRTQAAQWRELRAWRRALRTQRAQEDVQWRAQRAQLRSQVGQLPFVSAWIAVLVITDNCTRQCLDVPLFIAGAKVTAKVVVAALRSVLPAELQFVITDRGVHFTAQVFQQLARDEQFVHVVIARHRPESNGIAERFVRTLKEWLADKVWSCEQELANLVTQFRSEYTTRPHQGIAIPGLSPDEFAERIWLF